MNYYYLSLVEVHLSCPHTHFDQFSLVNAYEVDEIEVLRNVQVVDRNNVPRNANIISSHTLYKVKLNDESNLKLKEKIEPHGNEDSEKDIMQTDLCMNAPIRIFIVLSI